MPGLETWGTEGANTSRLYDRYVMGVGSPLPFHHQITLIRTHMLHRLNLHRLNKPRLTHSWLPFKTLMNIQFFS